MTAPTPTGPSAGTPTAAAVPLGLVPHDQHNVPQQRVGPNIQVNAPQQAFPNGLLGRSETSIATSPDGKQILVGFNDAQGFCGPLFGVPCTSGNPSGLSGYGFSTDGGRTFTDGGAPPNFDNVFTRGDPWMDRGGFDNKTFYYSNLSVDATTGDPLGISVHRGHFGNGTFSFFDVHTMNAPNPGDATNRGLTTLATDLLSQSLIQPIFGEEAFCGCRARIPGKCDSGRRSICVPQFTVV